MRPSVLLLDSSKVSGAATSMLNGKQDLMPVKAGTLCSTVVRFEAVVSDVEPEESPDVDVADDAVELFVAT